jgi:glutathione S-transferase
MVLKLYGASRTMNTKRVGVVLKETNTPFEMVELDWRKGEHQSPEYVAMQPFAQMPCLVRSPLGDPLC